MMQARDLSIAGTTAAQRMQAAFLDSRASVLDSAQLFSGTRHLAFMGAVLLCSLQFQTMPLGIKAQILPPSSVLSLLFLPFVLHRVPRSPLLVAVLLFAGYATVHSSIWLYVDMLTFGVDMRFIAWLRQIFALAAGVATFVVMRACFLHLPDRDIARFVIWGTVPALALAFLNILWGALKMGWAGTIVEGVRDIVSPYGFTAPMRASGFAAEPSTFAAVLVIVVVPVFLMIFGARMNRPVHVGLLALTFLSIAWTFSSIGIILLVALLVAGIVLGPSKRFMTRITLGVFLMFAAAVAIFPNNQIFRHAGAIATGTSNVSFNDRIYSTIGPYMTTFESFTMLGYGLGGTSVHFKEIIPADQQADILEVRWKELPNLGTLIGRIYAEIGAIGLALFLLFIYITFRQIRAILRSGAPRTRIVTVAAARLGFIVTLISLFSAFGSFHMPYLWLWMAVVDSRYILHLRARDAAAAAAEAPADATSGAGAAAEVSA